MTVSAAARSEEWPRHAAIIRRAASSACPCASRPRPLGQLPPEFSDLVAAADTHLLFHSTPDTTSRMAGVVDVPS